MRGSSFHVTRSLSHPRVAIVVSHPIQHFCPMYRSLASASFCEMNVFFASAAGLRKQWDPSFAMEISWEGLALEFPHRFLNGGAVLPLGRHVDAADLDRALEDYDPDVVVLYGYSQPLQRRALRWGTRNSRIMLMISDSESRHRQSLSKRALKKLILPGIYRRVHGFLTVGDANEVHYQSHGVSADRLFRAPFPIDRDLFDAAFQVRSDLGRAFRSELNISESSVVCGIVGKFELRKRQLDLIEALRHLEGCETTLTALIIGAGKDEQTLRSAAATLKRHAVVFTGFVPPTILPKCYAAIDIYVHASSVEPHSLAISEAIYMGCPVILSDRCGSYGATDDVQPGRNGLVYPCGDVSALADRIRQLAESRRIRESFGAASRSIAVGSQVMAHGGGLAAALTALRLS